MTVVETSAEASTTLQPSVYIYKKRRKEERKKGKKEQREKKRKREGKKICVIYIHKENEGNKDRISGGEKVGYYIDKYGMRLLTLSSVFRREQFHFTGL